MRKQNDKNIMGMIMNGESKSFSAEDEKRKKKKEKKKKKKKTMNRLSDNLNEEDDLYEC